MHDVVIPRLEDIEPDLLVLNGDGTAVVAFGPAPVAFDDEGWPDPDAGTFLPAWFVPRPAMGPMRKLMELYSRLAVDLVRTREERRAATAAMAAEVLGHDPTDEAAAAEHAAAGAPLQDVSTETGERVIAAKDAELGVTEDLMWVWWEAVAKRVAIPIDDGTPWPRPVTRDDAPPWLLRNVLIYNTLTEHWMHTPLARGGPGKGTPLPGLIPIQQGPMPMTPAAPTVPAPTVARRPPATSS